MFPYAGKRRKDTRSEKGKLVINVLEQDGLFVYIVDVCVDASAGSAI